MKNCEWCKKYNKPCGGKGKNCDFKTLEYSKFAILKRLNEESMRVALLKKKLLSEGVDKHTFEVMTDIVNGMQIMVMALKRDFGMTDEDIQGVVVVEKTTTYQKLKLLAMAKKAKYQQGGD